MRSITFSSFPSKIFIVKLFYYTLLKVFCPSYILTFNLAIKSFIFFYSYHCFLTFVCVNLILLFEEFFTARQLTKSSGVYTIFPLAICNSLHYHLSIPSSFSENLCKQLHIISFSEILCKQIPFISFR